MRNMLRIDRDNGLIIMDRTFSAKSSIVGSREYEMLTACCQANPTFTVVRRHINKNNDQERYKGLTIDFMEKYIESHSTNKDEDLKALRQMTGRVNEGELENKKNYPDIKKWFLAKFDELRVERENLNKAIPA